tara:strand:- start:657 stop:1874 length:1218 start_codon:yes stop_codon:yes gene_type:complete
LTLATYKFDGHEDDTRYYLNELNKELNRQFYKDGTNFEGSSHYSAFVTEALIIFKLSLDTINWDSDKREYLLTGKPTVKFNEIEDFQLIRLIKKIVFSNRNFLNLLMVNGELSQIGDNDSGRLFYFYHDEDEPLKINWLINLIDHFFNFEIEKNLGRGFQLIHSEDINSVSGSKMVSKSSAYIESLGLGTTEPESDFYSLKKLRFSVTVDPVDLTSFSKVDHPSIKIFQNDFNLYSFTDFGIFIWRNNDGSEYFSIRCGQIGQKSVGGHSHYDQLAIECFADGKWLARDPGTGTYTDDIETRNEFRSMKFHWGPNADIKFPKESEFDCFKLNYMEDGKLLFLDKNNFLGSAVFNGNKIYRKIVIENGNILISDFSNDTNLNPYENWGELNEGFKFKFSKGYKRIN